MRVLVVGSGGREHALAYKLARSAQVRELICAPGNAGTAQLGENLPLAGDDLDGLAKLAGERAVDLTVVGPEAPLCAGIVDRFQQSGLRIFGPTAAAARIEGDKAYAKRLMKSAHVPTAEGRVFEHYDSARDFIATRDTGVVVKAAGLAAGKGVFVCEDPADALLAVEKIMVDRIFGEAGRIVVVEELLKGPELSVFALVSGQTIYVLDAAQDHKPVGEGDTGPNTGGMGAFTPPPVATPAVMTTIEREILVPIVDALRRDKASYRGLLYAGLMLTAAGPKVLEFNCRFGDPETQPLLMRLDSDLFELLSACVDDRLDQVRVSWSDRAAVCVVMASHGYPGSYEKNKPMTGLSEADAMPDVCVFHAGTRKVGDGIVTSGGRVLGVTALGDDLASAQARAYEAVDKISYDGAFCRRDIAGKALVSA
jgi:phosphoribosylamine--glycine ligase